MIRGVEIYFLAEMIEFTRGDDIFQLAEMNTFFRGDDMSIRGDEMHRLRLFQWGGLFFFIYL